MESKIVRSETAYRKIVFDKDRIAGAIMLGDVKDFNKIVKMMADRADISALKDSL
jgi:NAD(P)H-nitrite reductase large subunit